MDGVRPKMPAAKLTGKAFRISEDEARSYRYAKPMRSNPGVTHIAAINGPGAYRRKMSARQAMAGTRTQEERAERARQALPKSRSKKMATYYGPRPNPTPAQMAARKRFAEMARTGALKRMRSNASTKARKTRTRATPVEPIRGMPVRIIGSAAAPRRSAIGSVKSTARGGYSPAQQPARKSTQRGYAIPGAARGPGGTQRMPQAASARRSRGPGGTQRMPAVKQRSAKMQSAIERAIKMIEAGRRPFGKGLTSAVIAEAYRVLGMTPPKKASARMSKRRTKKATPAAAGAKKGSKVAKRKKTAKKAAAPKRRRRKGAKKAAKRSVKKTARKRKAKKGSRKSAKRSAAARKAARTRKANKAKRSAAAKKGARKRRAKKGSRKAKAAARPRKRRAKKGSRKAKAAARPRKRRAKKGSRKGKSRKRSLTAAHAALRRKMGWRGAATLEREGWTPPRKRRAKKGSRKAKKGVRRNSMRKNAMGDAVISALKVGGTITAGFVAHKAVSHVLNTIVFDRLLTPAAAEAAAESAPTTTEAAKAAEGVGEIATMVRSAVGGGVAALAGVMLTNFLIKDQETKQLLAGGMVASYVHGLLVTALEALVPDVVPMLSGDGSAARLSAMMGLGASIDPQYAPISGYGEYLAEGTSGLGEYFESGTAGLGNYGTNPDIYEAAAGYGAIYEAAAGYGGSNHISPSSNLEHELTMAEAAAGVGVMPYEASAGYGEYFEGPMAGFGDVAALPGVDTAIPGGQLWAGVRSVDQGQNDTAMVPAGILETPGGAGILG
jgi:hypothetical protein